MLNIEKLDVSYGDVHVLKNVSLNVNERELVTVIGANGAGKSTLLKSVSGLLKLKGGSITFMGKKISGMDAHSIVAEGIVQVPEGRMLFPYMTVKENLEMGGYLLKERNDISEHLESVYSMFPILKERERQLAGTLSGGEQQMVAIGRAMMTSPKLVMFDEPSLGLAPKIVKAIFDMIVKINREMGVSVLLVEQNVRYSCQICDRAFVMENGEVVLNGTGPELLNNEHVRRAYLGL